MKAWIRIAMLVSLTVCGTIAPSAQEPKPAVDQSRPAAGAPAADYNLTPYRKLATAAERTHLNGDPFVLSRDNSGQLGHAPRRCPESPFALGHSGHGLNGVDRASA
jgi:hypothetical protein